jgi:hypothetical protein
MNRVNPFVLVLVMVLVLLALVYKDSSAKSRLTEAQTQGTQSEAQAKRVSDLKLVWEKSDREAGLKSIFGQNAVTSGSRSYTIKTAPINRQSANDMLSKLFGDAYEVSKFSMSAPTDESVVVSAEIAK